MNRVGAEQLAGEALADPHNTLGLHEGEIRLWRPGARKLSLMLQRELVDAEPLGGGLFRLEVPSHTTPQDYQTFRPDGLLTRDPYTFSPVGQSRSGLGARLTTHEGVRGTLFSVWAPRALRVSVVGEFNGWDPLLHPMRRGESGVWELFLPGVEEGALYKFALRSSTGEWLWKADPHAHWSEQRPGTASRVFDLERYCWADGQWRERDQREHPISIYEVHLGSWRRNEGQWLSYRELAEQLADYCLEMGFTHVELLPVTEHPFDGSWGYQVSGYYAPTNRFGTPRDFQAFVDTLHGRGIGVFLDWVPGHFPADEWSLGDFDGSPLYEYCDPQMGMHPHWTTKIFDFGKSEVREFLIGSALFWLEQMHIDGLRVDAVSSMVYRNFGREEGQWSPNARGGSENLEAIEFLRQLNEAVRSRSPHALMMAEESHAFPGVTHAEGLGFDYKWDLGWMNDTLRVFETAPEERLDRMHHIQFGMIYHHKERHMLPLSHDEVVHLKRSLLGKMGVEPHAHLRLLLSYLYTYPGPPLLFMGGEFGQRGEWDHDGELEWGLLDDPAHRGVQGMVKRLNQLHQEHLWNADFEWIQFEEGLVVFRRGELVAVHNFLLDYHDPPTRWGRRLFSSDDPRWGGEGAEGLGPLTMQLYESV